MEKCVHCGSETELYKAGVPICVKCAEALDRKLHEHAPVKPNLGKSKTA
jgi:hypothetical protein